MGIEEHISNKQYLNTFFNNKNNIKQNKKEKSILYNYINNIFEV